MGYLPKHIKVRRFKRNMRIIATAALSGATFERSGYTDLTRRQGYWGIRYPDGGRSHDFYSKSEAAATYLLWWFNKHGMLFPARRVA